MENKNIIKNLKGKHRTIVLYSVASLFMVAVAMNMAANTEKDIVETELESKVTLANISDFYGSESTIEAIGEVEALDQITINSQLSSTIKTVQVEIGDEVKAGDLLIELDHAALDAQLAQAKAQIDSAQSSLDKLLEGASNESISQSTAAVESTKSANAVALRNAEAALENAELALENAQESNKQQLQASYDNLRVSLVSNISNIYNALVSMGNILGKEPGSDGANTAYDDILSVKNISYRYQAEQDFRNALSEYYKLKPEVDTLTINTSESEIKSLANKILSLLEKMTLALDSVNLALENTITSSAFNEVSLNSLKSQISTQISSINQAKQAVLNNKQQVDNSALTDDNSLETYTQQYKDAERNLALIRRQTTSSLATQVASHESLLAPARNEDVAAYEANLASAHAAYQQILVNRNYAFIKAPFDGVVATLPVDKGDLVSLGTPLVTLVNDQGLQLQAYLSEQDINKVEIGSAVKVEENINASVLRIAPSLDTKTRKVEILITVNDQESSLIVGQYANIKIQVNAESIDDIYYLPLKMVEINDEGGIVYTLDDNNFAVAHQVEVGQIVNEKITILSGLEANWQIIKNVRGIRDGQEVIVNTL